MMRVAAIIPARMGSSRYPGKPLVSILGLPMVEHVRRRVAAVKSIQHTLVATCDREIETVVQEAGGRVVMTAATHERATERIEEAARDLDVDIVINVQGDEPMVLEAPLLDLLAPFERDPTVQCTCLVYPIHDPAELSSDNIVKTVISRSGRVLYFSRAAIPGRGVNAKTQYYKQSGLMAFRKEALHRFVQLPMTPLEIQESVDLLRLLENDMSVQAVVSQLETKGVDVPSQVQDVEQAILSDPSQRRIYESILRDRSGEPGGASLSGRGSAVPTVASISAPVAVASRTFSRHPILREEMCRQFSNVLFNDDGVALAGTALVQFLEGREGAVLALERFDANCISQLPALRAVSKYGVGLDNIDLQALAAHGKQLAWTGGVNRRSVAELTLAFMLGLVRNVLVSSRQLGRREWVNFGGTDLTEKTVGIIGCGSIGTELMALLKPFRCRLLVNDIRDVSETCRTFGARSVTKGELLRAADIVTLHIPYSKENHHLIGAVELEQMKPSAVLVNTSRGGIVDESALYLAIESGRLAGAAMDVFATEPAIDSPLLGLQRFFGTPHIGGSSQEAILAMGRAAISGLAEALGVPNQSELVKSEGGVR